MLRLFVEPLDVLMFRSSRPFIARETHMAKMGAISPTVFAGALKTKILVDFCSRRGIDHTMLQRGRNEEQVSFENRVKKLVEQDGELGEVLRLVGHPVARTVEPNFKVRGVFLAKEEKGEYVEYFRLPNDFVQDKDGKRHLILSPFEGLSGTLGFNGEVEIVLTSELIRFEPKGGFISYENLLKYLRGFEASEIEHLQDKPYHCERRPGIELEPSKKTTREGYLYVAEFHRLSLGWGFSVWYETPSQGKLPKEGLLRLGGEGRGAYYRHVSEKKVDLSSIVRDVNRERRFKLYLATPVAFDEGWKPNTKKLEKMLGVGELKLVAALPGKPIYLGGYDVARNEEKPLRRGVDAGAVYFFKFKEGGIREDMLFPFPISDHDQANGLGVTLLGRW